MWAVCKFSPVPQYWQEPTLLTRREKALSHFLIHQEMDFSLTFLVSGIVLVCIDLISNIYTGSSSTGHVYVLLGVV